MTDYLKPHRLYNDNTTRDLAAPAFAYGRANQCETCGVEIPEGNMVCKACQAKAEEEK